MILFFGQGRRGDRYFAVDVTYKKPQLLWSIGPTTAGLGSIGQTWSTSDNRSRQHFHMLRKTRGSWC